MEINGGGGSSFKKLMPDSNKGPIKTIFIGKIIVDTVFFQTIGDAVPRKESGCFGKPRGPVDPKSEVLIKRKENPEMMKRITNFVLEIFMFIIIKRLILRVSYRENTTYLFASSMGDVRTSLTQAR